MIISNIPHDHKARRHNHHHHLHHDPQTIKITIRNMIWQTGNRMFRSGDLTILWLCQGLKWNDDDYAVVYADLILLSICFPSHDLWEKHGCCRDQNTCGDLPQVLFTITSHEIIMKRDNSRNLHNKKRGNLFGKSQEDRGRRSQDAEWSDWRRNLKRMKREKMMTTGLNLRDVFRKKRWRERNISPATLKLLFLRLFSHVYEGKFHLESSSGPLLSPSSYADAVSKIKVMRGIKGFLTDSC